VSAPVTEQAAILTIDAACRTLRLPTVRQQAAPMAEAAVRDRLTHRAYLAEVLAAELDDREARRRERRIAEARFPRLKRLAEFDLAAAPTVSPTALAALETCAWITAGEPVVLLGDSGTGKSHLLIGLGIAACEQGRRVRYTTTAALVNELAEAADERTLSRVVARYGRLDLLCLDELAYVHLDPRGAELLFQILTEREERASVAVQRALQRMGPDLHRLAPGGCRRRPADLPGPHHRDRLGVVPAAGEPVTEGRWSGGLIRPAGWGQIWSSQWGQMGLSFPRRPASR
jgi:DNA replication protein DnaC